MAAIGEGRADAARGYVEVRVLRAAVVFVSQVNPLWPATWNILSSGHSYVISTIFKALVMLYV